MSLVSSVRTGLVSPFRRLDLSKLFRCISGAQYNAQRHSSSKNIEVSLDSSTEIAVLKLTRKPVNSLNEAMLNEMIGELDKLESSNQCKGLIITSGVPKVYCAGLDISYLYKPKQEDLKKFWLLVQEFSFRLYASKLSTVAAINGASPAGGCLVSLCCDYRVMAKDNYTIGLNEVMLGFPPPYWLMTGMQQAIGQRRTEHSCIRGIMYTAQQALDIGLVDEIVPEDQVVDAARNELLKFLKVPDNARQLSKQILRQPLIDMMRTRGDEFADISVGYIMSPECQAILEKYWKSLKEKKPK